jgi:hypothetical protein
MHLKLVEKEFQRQVLQQLSALKWRTKTRKRFTTNAKTVKNTQI